MADSKLNEIIQTSLSSIREVIDANTIIGAPIDVDNGSGTVIIPVSRVSMGYASGGVDFIGKKGGSTDPMNFGGGGGTGVSVHPVGFLVIKNDGSVSMLNVNTSSSGSGDSIAALIEKSPEFISKIKGFFAKKKDDEDASEDDTTEE